MWCGGWCGGLCIEVVDVVGASLPPSSPRALYSLGRHALPPASSPVPPTNTSRRQILLDAGADVNLGAPSGASPLHIAAKKDYAEVARVLLEYGADVNQPDCEGGTPIYVAAKKNSVHTARVLIEYGVDVNRVKTKHGACPL